MTTPDNNQTLSADDQSLISQYLDDELDASAAKTVRENIESNPAWRNYYHQLKTLSLNLATADGDNETTDNSNLWANISGQLNQDTNADILAVDEEFISAYYDNEIPTSDPEYTAFEAQLYKNDEANRALGNVQVISETIRQFGYRLEESCTLDITESVMTAYQQELTQGHGEETTVIELPDVPDDVETISAFMDGELSARDTMTLNGRMEAEVALKETLSSMQAVQDRFADINTQLMEQISDDTLRVWPNIETQVAEHIENHKKTLPFARMTPVKKAGSIAAVAAVAFLLISGTPLAFMNPSQTSNVGNNSSLLSSLPDSSKPFAVDRMDKMEGASFAEESDVQSNQMAIYDHSVENGTYGGERQQMPSSEAYLFETLKEDMSDDELGILLGI